MKYVKESIIIKHKGVLSSNFSTYDFLVTEKIVKYISNGFDFSWLSHSLTLPHRKWEYDTELQVHRVTDAQRKSFHP